jgi:hypothetical protein
MNMVSLDLFANRNDENIVFSLKKLEEIASQLPDKYLVDRDTIMFCPEICESKSFVIQFNAKNQVSHLGISMFSKEIKKIINEPVCTFVERFLLELTLADNNSEINSMLDHYGILLQRNGKKLEDSKINSMNAILNEIQDPVSFTLTKDDKSYTAAWEYGQQNLFAIQFPINRELIIGTNKIEADNVLFDQLQDNNCNNLSTLSNYMPDDTRLISIDGSLFVCKGDSFLLGAINENKYYKKTDKGYELLFDDAYPNESLSNLFFGNFENNNLKIHVTHSMYGNFNPDFEMKLNDFICFFKNDFKIYAGSYEKEPGVINSTIIFQNKLYNYINLLIISTKKENIFNRNGVLSASFRSNIPQHNINSLINDIINK